MAFSFMRGRQMIVHDPRLNNPYANPPTPLYPPAAENVWTVSLADTAEDIISWIATVAGGDSGNDALDVHHFMAHGYPGGVQIGLSGLSWANVDLFKQLNGYVFRTIVFFSCAVGAEQQYHPSSYEMTFGNAVATYADCRVIACKANQIYGWNGSSVIDFGNFEGVVYRYQSGGHGASVYNYSKRSRLSLEHLVFG